MPNPIRTLPAVLALCLAASPLGAEETLDAQTKSVRLRVREAEIPAEVKTSFAVSVAVTQDGRAAPKRSVDDTEVSVLKNGSSIVVEISSERDGFLRVFYHNAKGELIQLLPNQFAADGFIRAGSPLLVGGPEDDYELVVEPPLGAECLAVLVSTRPFTDEGQIAALLKEKAFIEIDDAEVANAGLAVTKSVALVPREALVGAALIHVETVE